MREIKFRQWQPDTKTFLYIHQVQAGAPLRAENILHDGELQQYTGLKDKNSLDIYEGDIVSFHPPYRKEPTIFKVEYMELENCGDCFDDSGIGFNFHLCAPDKCEIIGNVWENPELLD